MISTYITKELQACYNHPFEFYDSVLLTYLWDQRDRKLQENPTSEGEPPALP